ncbi:MULTISPECIES: indole-3-glycerol-phosphate synthase [Methanoculleus]|uniref:Indole-3-glycerol phosphate synthase n=2 Tax=Methanoculleus TaxID=45989 RepID=A3CRK9_METMJ|nr:MULTISPECIES: indole-3-glycerol-phosphate synthase [Methanoculleus]ABN56009.1 indole-3-glycerol phosphate synthase [Methanoculleus marisnigri JR1]UYU17491.1 indole-3-glycerol-phosphate synthase [Methanoculleus submarinus]
MILDDIVRSTRERLRDLDQSVVDPDPLPRRSLAAAIRTSSERHAVIAEVKYASPSRGRIHEGCTPEAIAREFVAAGAAGLSVLTEPTYFSGSIENLARVRRAVSVPVLRKDFIVDERQLGETRALGADAVLLIARVLGNRLPAFVDSALALGLEPLVEVHDRDEMERALATNATLIGINNRNLATMTIDLSTTVRLAGAARDAGRVVVSESGIMWPYDVRSLSRHCDAFLIGSALMSARDRRKRLEGFVFA